MRFIKKVITIGLTSLILLSAAVHAVTFIYGTVLNGEDKIIARVPHDYDYKNHETIDFHFDYANMHCFDSNTGLRL